MVVVVRPHTQYPVVAHWVADVDRVAAVLEPLQHTSRLGVVRGGGDALAEVCAGQGLDCNLVVHAPIRGESAVPAELTLSSNFGKVLSGGLPSLGRGRR